MVASAPFCCVGLEMPEHDTHISCSSLSSAASSSRCGHRGAWGGAVWAGGQRPPRRPAGQLGRRSRQGAHLGIQVQAELLPPSAELVQVHGPVAVCVHLPHHGGHLRRGAA